MIGRNDGNVHRNKLDEKLIERLCSIDKNELKIMVDTFLFIFGEQTFDDKRLENKVDIIKYKENINDLKYQNTNELNDVLTTNIVDDLNENNRNKSINEELKFGMKSENVEYKCNQCSDTFKYEKSMYTHMNDTHSKRNEISTNLIDETVYKCTLGFCDITFPSNILHENHLETTHFNIDKVNTALVAKADDTIIAKVNTKKEPKDRTCDFCDFEFNVTKSNFKLVTHLKSFHFNKDISALVEQLEMEDRKVVCNICGEKLRSSQILVSHMKLMHTSLKMAPCHICGKLLKQHDAIISSHLQSHKQDGFSCEYCGVVLRSKKSHKEHQTVHMTDVKKVKCDECDLLFDRKTYLYKHKQRIHSNKSPEFKSCDSCGKMFSSVSKLKIHISSIHLQEKPFSCNLCEYKTARKDNLSTHKRGVHGNEEYINGN